MGHDYHGGLGLICRVAGLQKDGFKVQAGCREKAGVSETSPTSQRLPQPRPQLQRWHGADQVQRRPSQGSSHHDTLSPLKLVCFSA